MIGDMQVAHTGVDIWEHSRTRAPLQRCESVASRLLPEWLLGWEKNVQPLEKKHLEIGIENGCGPREWLGSEGHVLGFLFAHPWERAVAGLRAVPGLSCVFDGDFGGKRWDWR